MQIVPGCAPVKQNWSTYRSDSQYLLAVMGQLKI